MLRALAAAGGTLPLLPGGAVKGKRVAEATVEKGGESRHVVAWELAGFGLTPSVSWFDDDGAWFGDVWDGGHTVREG